MGIPDHLTCLLQNPCAGQEAALITRHGTMDGSKLGKEYIKVVYCHNCLFNLCAENIMQNARLDEAQAGIKIAGRNIDNLRYTVTTLMAESEEKLKSLLIKVKEDSEKVA